MIPVQLLASLLLLTLSTTGVRWTDLPGSVQQRLIARNVGEARFPSWVNDIRAANEARLRDGNYDHLIHYALQSTRVTTLPPIEPALSAKAFVESKQKRIPDDARARLIAVAAALSKAKATKGQDEDARLAHFRRIVGDLRGAALETQLIREYERAMRFLYEKEFVAGRTKGKDGAAAVAAVAALYQTRGHSSDTEIEAGYAVYTALATLKQLAPTKAFARVLIVGPGLDLAPRTALLESADPQSYQPFAVADALRALRMDSLANIANVPGLGYERRDLRIDAVDLNPHVASAIERAVRSPGLTLHVTSGIADTKRTRFTPDYRAYLDGFGNVIGISRKEPDARGHVRKRIAIAPDIQAAIHASRLDIVTERLAVADDKSAYDLVIVTNVFPYLSDPELIVAIANIAAVLAPDGALIHNEPRRLLQDTAASVGLSAIFARSVLIATVPGGNDLYDAIWIHQKR